MGQASSSPNENGVKLIQESLAGHLDEVKSIIEQNDDGSAGNTLLDAEGNSALGAAACGGHLPIVAYLLDAAKSSDQNNVIPATFLEHKNKIGTTPFWLACGYGHVDVAKLLQESGADINAVNSSGDTALVAACHKGHGDVVSFLVEKEVDVWVTNKSGDSPVSIVASKGNSDILPRLLAQSGSQDYINRTNSKGISPLASAASAGDVKCVEQLLSSGADPTVLDSNGVNALGIAAFCGNGEIVRALIAATGEDEGKKVALLEHTDKSGATPLWLAASAGKTDCVEALLAAGARKDATAQDMTPLKAAQKNQHEGCVAALSQ